MWTAREPARYSKKRARWVIHEQRVNLKQHRPKLVSVTWIPTRSGLVQPVHDVGDICAEAGVPYLVDACQAVGQMPAWF